MRRNEHTGKRVLGWLIVVGIVSILPTGSDRDGARAEAVPAIDTLTPAMEAAEAWGPLAIANTEVRPGERARGAVAASQSFAGVAVKIPIVLIRGETPGPTLCAIAGVHGDELNGIEIVRRVTGIAKPNEIAGTLIAVPIANPHGFRRSSRYLPDRRDLNRHFPGRSAGSAASRIAWALFEGVVTHCEAIVDFHTGSFHRTNMPHVRADLASPSVARLARQFGPDVIVHNEGQLGTLRRSATDIGVPCITYEVGEPMRLDESGIVIGVQGVVRLMRELGISNREVPTAPTDPEVYYTTRWLRADAGGILPSRAALGERVGRGELLGSVVDPVLNGSTGIRSPQQGRVIGMALDQVVIPGFAAYHLGVSGPIDASESTVLGGDIDPEEVPVMEPHDHPE